MARFVHASGYAINLDAVTKVGFETDDTARLYFDATDYLALDFGSTQTDAREGFVKLSGSVDSALYA